MITKSTYIQDAESGRRYVTEIHEDDKKGKLFFTYLAEDKTEVEEIMKARATWLNTPIEEVLLSKQEGLEKIDTEMEIISSVYEKLSESDQEAVLIKYPDLNLLIK